MDNFTSKDWELFKERKIGVFCDTHFKKDLFKKFNEKGYTVSANMPTGNDIFYMLSNHMITWSVKSVCLDTPLKQWCKETIIYDLEMIALLRENPKRKAYLKYKNDGSYVEFKEDRLIWNGFDQEGQPFLIAIENNQEWIIVEPKQELKQMSFTEMFEHFLDKKYATSIVSGVEYNCVKNKDYNKIDTIMLLEMNGLWTVEGVYE